MGTAQMGMAFVCLFVVNGLGWPIQRSLHETGISKISLNPKRMSSPFVPSPFVSFGLRCETTNAVGRSAS